MDTFGNITKITDDFLQPGASYQRLIDEYDKYGSLCIGCDFDSTINDYHQKGYTYDLMLELLDDLASIGCKIVIWTAYKDLEYVQKYVDEHDIPCDGINTDGISLPWQSRKPFFSALLDDRAGLIQVYEDLKLLVMTIKSRK